MLISVNFNHAKTGELFTAKAIIVKEIPDLTIIAKYTKVRGGVLVLWETTVRPGFMGLKVDMPENAGLGWVNDIYREIKKHGGTR